MDTYSLNEKGPLIYLRTLSDKVYINDQVYPIDLKEESNMKIRYTFLDEND